MREYKVEPDTAEGEALRVRLRAFLTANGIDPADVPVTSPVKVYAHGRRIDYTVYDRDDDGNRYAVGNELATRRETAPLVAPLPKVAA